MYYGERAATLCAGRSATRTTLGEPILRWAPISAKNGWGLYGLLGIGKADKDKMHAQHHRNYLLFDAPVGLMFTMHRSLGYTSLVHYGAFLQNIMIAARLHGLHTCPQAAWNDFAKIILPHVGAGVDDLLVCGMALGHADENAVVNSFYTPRSPVAEFTRWMV
jgi:nitroreductase